MKPLAANDESRMAPFSYDPALEQAIDRVERYLTDSYPLSRRSVALLLLQRDSEISDRVRAAEGNRYPAVEQSVEMGRSVLGLRTDDIIAVRLRSQAAEIARSVTTHPSGTRVSISDALSRLTMSPITGLPILALALWFGLYQFVGFFGGGTLVKLLEGGLFGQHLNPWMTGLITRLIPWPWLSDLFVGDYGIWTLGVTYAVALIFPVVGTFFLAFSVLEDTGYFPRLAMLIDRLFKGIGLNGKAVIPIVLGFGCDTMATIVTRILETRRERIIATFLLSLAIPCSAQIGVMTALLTGHPAAFGLWVGIMAAIFLVIGYLTARLLPGESARFAMEIPPLRWPSFGNIVTKTFARMQWYFMEVLPLFILASVFIWMGRLTGLFGLTVRGLTPVARALGLPDATAETFLFGFFRRDYGAAGLYRMRETGTLSGNQLLVAVVTLTIFLPCVAQFLMVKKERGLKMAIGMAAFIFPFAIVIGGLLNLCLVALKLRL